MTKFEEMCSAYAASRKTYFDYRNKCFSYMRQLVSGFLDYCAIPKDQVRFLPVKDTPKPNSTYSLPGAMHLDDDTYWHIGLEITLYEEPNIFPHQPILLVLCIREQDGKLFVKIGPDDKPRRVDISDTKQCTDLFDHIVDGIKRYFQGSFQEFLEQSAPLKKIGFGETQGLRQS